MSRVTDRDVYLAANLLMRQHGAEAPIHAAMRADEFLQQGDMDGYATYKRILKAIDELLAPVRPSGQTLQ